MTPPDAVEELHARHYGRLFGLAYRMLGSATEAEDVVQDTFERWTAADRLRIREPAAWLTTVATRLCLDRLQAARRRREEYVGPWLPEPIATDVADPADVAGAADSLTLAFLVVLESLSPLERAVFVLHEVFGYPHADIAGMLERTPAAVRQVAARARRHLEQRRPRYSTDRAQQWAVAEAFLAACAGEDIERMLGLLAPDVTFTGDGGGVVAATRAPISGSQRVAAMLVAFWRSGRRWGWTVEPAEVNAQPGLVVRNGDTVESVMVVDVVDGRIAAVRAVRNPTKLEAFGRRQPHAP